MLTQRQLFLQHNAQTSPEPLMLEFVRAKGIYIYDAQNKKHIDLIAGIGVSNVGHCHPAVVKAIQEQAETYMHLMVYGEYVQTPQVNFAKALADILPESLSCTYFLNSGTEAVEGAMKLAKRYTGRKGFIACKNAYHGSTQGAESLMESDFYSSGYGPFLPHVSFIEHNNIADLEKITSEIAAVFIEPIQGEAGIRVADLTYMQALRAKCTETRTLLIFDEIQSGFGRSGKMFAFEHYNIVPDVLLLAKGIGGGMPIGAFISSLEIMSVLSHTPILGHMTTFGGHPVCCAAGLATLRTLVDDHIVDEVEEKGQLFKQLLQHPAIREIRGKGLMLAVEFENFEINKKIIDACILNGVLSDWFLHCSNSMRIAPPLVITKEEIEEACAIILKNINLVLETKA
ncbi:[LysW]-aminoadipate semialdehyde transaminase [Pedobacter sp. Bi27]|uniref:aspartate aminotransferase family protein n=1 Tax=unclassified Pedobacter TaxID=2628915 RepID=UPI001DE4A6EA|nr:MULTISPECIES: aspartate aminotransferase family protein [unclassified Pedobacter]CAH0315557.1 [LysW]-aminoadipate semialdehyde transaminase [Pedobacter sp. Bi36]CAH0319684.1 [LysW]-aminoadipate semialdehyde transaminase [Pedobacter sp. Bi27]CAH0320019.1 [LysW]-aminoadipate semialdehyde transaminase [Pedobacter sp. Bi126]